jgi:hypothetical protein
MIFAVTLAGLHLMALAIAGADPIVGQSVFALAQAGLGAAALAYGPTRRALIVLLGHYWPAALAFMAVVMITAWQAGLLGAPAVALNPFAAQVEVWSLAALVFAIAAPAAAAAAFSRRPLFEATLLCGLGFAALDIGRKLQAGPDQTLLATSAQTAAVYALFAVLAAFTAYDSVRSPSHDRADRRVSMRLMLPGATLGASLLGVVLCNQPLALAAMLAGLGACALALALREWPRRLTFVNAGFAVVTIGLAITIFALSGKENDAFGIADFNDSLATGMKSAFGLGSGAEGGPALIWLVEAGVIGASALGLAGAMLMTRLALSADRRKRPSRGLALALGAVVTVIFTGAGAASPGLVATLAIAIGLASTYADRLRKSYERVERPAAATQETPAVEEAPETVLQTA